MLINKGVMKPFIKRDEQTDARTDTRTDVPMGEALLGTSSPKYYWELLLGTEN